MRRALRGWGLVAIGVAVAVNGGCAGEGGPASSRPTAGQRTDAATPIPMMPIPPRYVTRCRSSTILRPVCPRLIPKVPHALGGGVVHGLVASGPIHMRSAGFIVFDLEHGAPYEQQPRLNRPPGVLHLTVIAGPRPSNLFGGMAYPGPKVTSTLKDGLDTGRRRKPLLFGLRRWGGHTGALFLAPSYPFGGQIGGHLTFWWRKGGHGYIISLHAWEPLTESAHVLRTIVASTR